MAATTSTKRTSGVARELVHALNQCIEVSTDAQKGYAIASADVRDPTLKKLFQLRSDEREELIVDLQRCVAELGGYAENEGSIEGALHRAWVATRVVMDGPSDYVLLVECQRGERAGLGTFEHALHLAESTPRVPERVKTLLGAHVASIRSAIDDLGKRIVGFAKS